MKEYTWHVWKIATKDGKRRDMHVGRVQADRYDNAMERATAIYGLKNFDYVEQGNEVR
jgi:hypothetical protein